MYYTYTHANVTSVFPISRVNPPEPHQSAQELQWFVPHQCHLAVMAGWSHSPVG